VRRAVRLLSRAAPPRRVSPGPRVDASGGSPSLPSPPLACPPRSRWCRSAAAQPPSGAPQFACGRPSSRGDPGDVLDVQVDVAAAVCAAVAGSASKSGEPRGSGTRRLEARAYPSSAAGEGDPGLLSAHPRPGRGRRPRRRRGAGRAEQRDPGDNQGPGVVGVVRSASFNTLARNSSTGARGMGLRNEAIISAPPAECSVPLVGLHRPRCIAPLQVPSFSELAQHRRCLRGW